MKTVSEEYTPLHLAARIIIPPRRKEETDAPTNSRVEGDNGGGTPARQTSKPEESTMEYLLKNCKGEIDVSCRSLKAAVLDDINNNASLRGSRPVCP